MTDVAEPESGTALLPAFTRDSIASVGLPQRGHSRPATSASTSPMPSVSSLFRQRGECRHRPSRTASISRQWRHMAKAREGPGAIPCPMNRSSEQQPHEQVACTMVPMLGRILSHSRSTALRIGTAQSRRDRRSVLGLRVTRCSSMCVRGSWDPDCVKTVSHAPPKPRSNSVVYGDTSTHIDVA